MKGKLTNKQEMFCREYMIDLNGTQAAIRAGYSAKTANEIAAENLAKPSVMVFLDTLKKKRTDRLEIKSDEVLQELKVLGHSDLRGIYDKYGCVLHPTDWPDELAKAIASIEVEELFEFDPINKKKILIGYTKKVKLWNKPQALELMGKHKKLFTEKIEHTVKVSLEDLVSDDETGKS